MSTLVASTITADTLTNQEPQLCKAWVNFDQVASTQVNGYNVSSVTDVSAGLFTVNFTNSFPNTNYIAVGITSSSNGYVSSLNPSALTNKTVSSQQFWAIRSTAAETDVDQNYIAFFSN